MKKMLVVALALLALFALALPASAQNVVNPINVSFPCSADHATVTKYTLGVFMNNTVLTPNYSFDLGKPTPDASNICTATIDLRSVNKGTWYGRIRAEESTSQLSAWGPPTPFDRALSAPGAPTFSR